LGIHLDERQIEQFERYYWELMVWNKRANLTAITDYEEVQIKHFLDSLSVALELDSVEGPVLDVGSGAGFPGLPLKIALPHVEMALIDATAKKTRFLQFIIKELGLEGVTVINARAEDAAHEQEYRESFAAVVSRAVAPLPTLAELTFPFCDIGGKLVFQKKGSLADELARGRQAAEKLGGRFLRLRPVNLSGLEDGRLLVVMEKVTPTPRIYPRRAGIPSKRPL
jgi:16S rRNA (guanine527-N7)-methyltransferase